MGLDASASSGARSHFVAGPSSQLAFAASQAAASSYPPKQRFVERAQRSSAWLLVPVPLAWRETSDPFDPSAVVGEVARART